MIIFKNLELSDKKDIDACLETNRYRACDYCFANIYAWNGKFGTQFAIKENTLFIRFKDMDGKVYYMMPIGSMPLEKAFDKIIEDTKEMNIPFLMKGITTRMWDDIQATMPDKFEYIPDEDNNEYIYLSEKLIGLKGKKLQSKRNHINRFNRENPDWQYMPILTKNDSNQCLKMLDEWEDEKNESNENDDNLLRHDYRVTKVMIENMDTLGLKGGMIVVNGKIVAFSLGEKLSIDTYVVHVEKAFGDMNGAYAIINQQFSEHEASEYKYINREEDLGLEHLRKAKLSYQPDIILQEGIVKMK